MSVTYTNPCGAWTRHGIVAAVRADLDSEYRFTEALICEACGKQVTHLYVLKDGTKRCRARCPMPGNYLRWTECGGY